MSRLMLAATSALLRQSRHAMATPRVPSLGTIAVVQVQNVVASHFDEFVAVLTYVAVVASAVSGALASWVLAATTLHTDSFPAASRPRTR